MPITKQAIKRMKQNEVAKTRKKHYGSRMKSMIKLILSYVHQGDMDKAKKTLPEAVKSIDTAAKKNIIHTNNAARKKSRLQKAVNTGVTKKVEVKPVKETKAKKAAPKTTTPKKEEKVDAKAVEQKESEAKEEEKA